VAVASAGSADRLTGKTLRTSIVALVALICVQSAVAAWIAIETGEARRIEGKRQAILVAARQQAVNMVTIDFRQADLGIQRISRGLTGKLRDDFGSKQAPRLADTVRKAQTVSQGTALSAGIVSLDEDSGEVIVAGNSLVRSLRAEDAEEGKPVSAQRLWRATIGLRLMGDRWLTDKLEMEIIG
jgi:Mce-associated membrane protein